MVGVWQQWSKKISDSTVAVLVMNNGDAAITVPVMFSTVPSLPAASSTGSYVVRDIWAHADAGAFESSFSVTLERHDSAFFTITAK
jgi:hypothetical protein